MIKGFNLAWVILLLVFPAQGETKDIWSLQPVKRPEVPNPDATLTEIRNPIDAFVQERLDASKLKPSTEADRRTLIRRLSFDLHGLPPKPKAIEAFVASKDPKAYEKLVDELLDSPHYGRTLRPALAGHRPLCGHPRLRARQTAAQRLALPGLRHPVLQRGQALRPLSAGTNRRGRPLA